MPYTDRFSVSLDTELLAAFDQHIARRGYENRSEDVRDMIRELLLATRLEQANQPAVAVLTMVCGRSSVEASRRVRALLHRHAGLVSTRLSMSMDEDRDFEALALRGTAGQVRALAEQLQSLKGVSSAHLAMQPL